MAKNFIQPGDHLTIPAPAAIESGQPILVGGLFGVTEHSAVLGQPLVIARKGVFRLPKATGQAWAVCAKVYFDATNRVITTTASGNTLVGVAVEAAVAGAVEGIVLLDGAIR